MEFKDNIRALREDNDLTQWDIAKLLNTNQRRISRLENGITEPCIQDIKIYCKIFKVSADWILNIEY